jgi:hypothetical protein
VFDSQWIADCVARNKWLHIQNYLLGIEEIPSLNSRKKLVAAVASPVATPSKTHPSIAQKSPGPTLAEQNDELLMQKQTEWRKSVGGIEALGTTPRKVDEMDNDPSPRKRTVSHHPAHVSKKHKESHAQKSHPKEAQTKDTLDKDALTVERRLETRDTVLVVKTVIKPKKIDETPKGIVTSFANNTKFTRSLHMKASRRTGKMRIFQQV